MSGLAYWLDRYALPPVVAVGFYLMAVFNLNYTDHYFQVDVAPASRSQFILGTDSANTYVKAVATPPFADAGYDQVYLAEVLDQWPFPETNGRKTLVVVAASGGGTQAAAWTSKVLTELDREFPGFSQSIGLISSVSGGSVGTMFYLGHRGLLPDIAEPESLLDDNARKIIQNCAEQSSLEAVCWGIAFPDLVRFAAPLAAPQWSDDAGSIDRGSAMEMWWWNTMGSGQKDRMLMQQVSIRDLIPLVKSGRIPPVVFNSTCVETGQRVLISPIHVAVSAPKNKKDEGLAQTPIDFLEFYDGAMAEKNRSNLLVSTAVRLSATFSYLTPFARPRTPKWLAETDNAERFNRHFCDGGYSDGSGLVTAVDAIRQLLDYYRDREIKPPFHQILVVRIEPSPKTATRNSFDNTGLRSRLFPSSTTLGATRDSAQAERSELELRLLLHTNSIYADNNSNTIPVHSITFWPKAYFDSTLSRTGVESNGTAPIESSLSWSLTESQKKDLNKAWKLIRSTDWNNLNLATSDTVSPHEIGRFFYARPEPTPAP